MWRQHCDKPVNRHETTCIATVAAAAAVTATAAAVDLADLIS